LIINITVFCLLSRWRKLVTDYYGYRHSHKINSIWVRPHTIYGVGREIGITSGPSKAIKSTILGRKYAISFSGKTSFNFVEDIADIFIGCSNAKLPKDCYSKALNIQGKVISSEEFLSILHEELPESKNLISIQKDAPTLPLAYDFNQKGLDALLPNQHYTSIRDGIRKAASTFKSLHANGQLHTRDLDQ